MPSAVAAWTLIGFSLGPDSVSVKFAAVVPELPSMTVTSLIETLGVASSSTIVTTPCPSPSSLCPSAGRSVSVTLNVSSNSSMLSLLIGTVKVLVVSPGAKFSVPL